MSSWTYVYGEIEVDTCGRDNLHSFEIIQRTLNVLPDVTGSEHNMEVLIDIKDGLNPPCFVLKIESSLRGRIFENTLREVKAWIKELAKYVVIHRLNLTVSNGIEKKKVFTTKYAKKLQK